jgi:hypothetical protein
MVRFFSQGRVRRLTMGRPFYPHEADDPDLDWLVSNFLYDRPDFIPVETGMLPLVLLPFVEEEETAIPKPASEENKDAS